MNKRGHKWGERNEIKKCKCGKKNFRLSCVIMGPGKKHCAEMCWESVKDAEKM